MTSTLYPALVAILRANGCMFVRQGKGSHEIWRSPMSDKVFSVPFTIKSKPTANAILKHAGIDAKV